MEQIIKISSAEAFRKYTDHEMGTVTAPLCCVLEKIRKIPEIEKINLCILDDNNDSLKYFFSMFSKDEIKITRNINYSYTH